MLVKFYSELHCLNQGKPMKSEVFNIPSLCDFCPRLA